MQQNLSNKDSVEPQWRSGGPGRGSRGGRMNFSSRHSSHGKQQSYELSVYVVAYLNSVRWLLAVIILFVILT